MRTRTALPLILILASSLVMGCVHHRYEGDDGPPGRRYGPPPHAPAHGYRAKYHDHDLVFDSHLGVYAVIGFPNLFWGDGWYHRRSGDRWQRAERSGGPWYDSRWDDVPPRLRGGDGKGGKGDKGGKDKSKDKSKGR